LDPDQDLGFLQLAVELFASRLHPPGRLFTRFVGKQSFGVAAVTVQTDPFLVKGLNLFGQTVVVIEKGLSFRIAFRKGGKEVCFLGDLQFDASEFSDSGEQALLVPVLDETAKSFGQRTLDEAGVDQVFEERNQRVNEFIRQQSLERMDSLTNETTRQALREELVQSLEAGESRKQTSNRIKKVFKEADDRRARVIARTETVRVANFATQEGMQQAGVPEKEWLSSRDERVRDHHLSLDSVTVPTQGEFVSPETGATAQHPGDFGRPVDDIQCRCIIVSKFPDQKSGESEAVRKSIWKAFEAEREPFEAQAKRAVSKAFKQQQDAVLAALDTVY